MERRALLIVFGGQDSDKVLTARWLRDHDVHMAMRLVGESAQPASLEALEADIDEWSRILRAELRDAEHVISRVRSARRACGWRTLTDIDHDSVRAYLADLQRRGRKGKTRRNHLSAIRTFVRWCLESGRLSSDPTAGIPTPRNDDSTEGVRALTVEEMRGMIGVALDTGGDGRRNDERAYVYILAATSGLRRAELRRLRVGMLDAPQAEIRLPANLAKNGRPAAIQLPEWVSRIFSQRIRNRRPEEVLFRSLPDCRTIGKDLSAAGFSTHCPRGRTVGLHSFRKGFVTALARAGVHPKTAQQMARHSDIALTMGVYTDIRDAECRVAAESLGQDMLLPDQKVSGKNDRWLDATTSSSYPAPACSDEVTLAMIDPMHTGRDLPQGQVSAPQVTPRGFEPRFPG